MSPTSPNQIIPKAPQKAESARLEPTEISIEPVVIIISCANAKSIITGVCCAINVQFLTDMNLSPEIPQKRSMTKDDAYRVEAKKGGKMNMPIELKACKNFRDKTAKLCKILLKKHV